MQNMGSAANQQLMMKQKISGMFRKKKSRMPPMPEPMPPNNSSPAQMPSRPPMSQAAKSHWMSRAVGKAKKK